MQIGIIGAGMIGSTVGRLWADAGHTVRFATRHPDRLDGLVKEIGANATATTVPTAVRASDVIFAAVPFGAWPALARDIGSDLDGKIVADASNPYPQRDGAMAKQAIDAGGTGAYFAALLPNTRLVRAFNTVYFATLKSEAHRAGERLGIPIAGDDQAALDTIAGLVRDAGFDPVVVGPLRDARKFDVGTAVYNKPLTAAELRREL
jgi:8-hydroxy-5-deazaflavin:NADPH oxidoreductase